MGTINDGSTQTAARVNDDNQLGVRSRSYSEEHFASTSKEQAYLVSSSQVPLKPTLTFLTGQAGNVLSIRNTGTINIVITSILASADIPGGIMTVYKNRLHADTLTQNTVIPAQNLNFGSKKISATTVDVWDESNGDGIQGITEGEIMRAIRVSTVPVTINTNGAVIVSQGQSMTIHFSNTVDPAATIEFECGFRYYFNTTST